MKKVYLDNAATTQLDPKVVDEMTSVLVNSFGNPSSTHFFGRDSKTIIELSRKFIAQTFNVKPSEIFFTSGGTESNNMIIKSCIKLTGFVNSIDSFADQPKVINGASDLIASIFGEAGMHTRAAVSTNSLPLGVSVEVDAIFELN